MCLLYFKLVLQRVVCWSLCDFGRKNVYTFFFVRTLKLLFFHLSPFVRGKNRVCISPSEFIRSHTNIKIQRRASSGFPESFYVLRVYRTYFTVFEKFECFFFFLSFVLVSTDRKVINHTGDSDFTRESFYGDEIKAQRELFFSSLRRPCSPCL